MGKNLAEFPTKKGQFLGKFLKNLGKWGTSDTVIPMNTEAHGEQKFRTPIDVDSLAAEGRAALGPLIRARREQRRMTQAELALAAGVDRKTLGTIESGKRAGQADKLRALLEALDIPQAGDADRRYSEATRMFIASTAPIFDRLPAEAQAEAQNDVVVLLTGKVARAAGVWGIRQDDERAAAHPRDEESDEGH